MVTEEQLNAESTDRGGLDAMINLIYEGEIYDGYKVLDISANAPDFIKEDKVYDVTLDQFTRYMYTQTKHNIIKPKPKKRGYNE